MPKPFEVVGKEVERIEKAISATSSLVTAKVAGRLIMRAGIDLETVGGFFQELSPAAQLELSRMMADLAFQGYVEEPTKRPSR